MLATIEKEKTKTKVKTKTLNINYDKDLFLCYASDDELYFTNKKASLVRGDDWDDVPLEHNAGEPYLDGCESWAIVRFRNPFNEFEMRTFNRIMDDMGVLNSDYSVDMLNKEKSFHWAEINKRENWMSKETLVKIFADCSLDLVLCYMNEYGIICEIERKIGNSEPRKEQNYILK